MRRKSLTEEIRRLRATLLPTRRERRHSAVGPPDLWREKRDFQIAFLRRQGLRPEHVLLDVGCGTLRGGIPVIEYLAAGHYHGVEARESVLEEGRAELREAGLESKRPSLVAAGDFERLEIDASFDFVWAFSTFIHMHDTTLRECLAFTARHLAPGGVVLANVNVGERGQGRWKEFPIVWRSVAFYEDQARAVGLTVEDLGDLVSLGHPDVLPGPALQHMLRMRAGA